MSLCIGARGQNLLRSFSQASQFLIYQRTNKQISVTEGVHQFKAVSDEFFTPTLTGNWSLRASVFKHRIKS
jgi:hypothetical protein